MVNQLHCFSRRQLLQTTLAFAGVILITSGSFAKQKAPKSSVERQQPASVVNWDPPSKRDIVERAVSDGMTDPAKIVKWAKDRNVTMTVDEVNRLKAQLKK